MNGKTVILMLSLSAGVLFSLICAFSRVAGAQNPPGIPFSRETQRCIDCHRTYSPGIVEEWRASNHGMVTPAEAMKRSALERLVSSETVPENLKSIAVGCFECHSLNPSLHKDNFLHFGMRINVIVSPNDCKTCHSVEWEEYSESKKAWAYDNLEKNSWYMTLINTLTGLKEVKTDVSISVKGQKMGEMKEERLITHPPSAFTKAETCYACHGTQVTVKGTKKVTVNGADVFIPELANWPNQGVGRVNPDGSRGCCTACHPRHSFSLEVARKPFTCSECHLEPDFPGFNVYEESKHGNIFNSKQDKWNWGNIPWRAGQDFPAPTCAVCHSSLIVKPDGTVILPRSHNFGARLWVRIMGFIYAHPQPKDGRTYLIKNKDGLPLPTTLAGDLAQEYLIDEAEQKQRQAKMQQVCLACHGVGWTDGHFAKFDSTIVETNTMTRTATVILSKAWQRGLADRTNPFDEAIEQRWIKQWLFFANSVRFASAMQGPDYASLKNGWWDLSTNLVDMYRFLASSPPD